MPHAVLAARDDGPRGSRLAAISPHHEGLSRALILRRPPKAGLKGRGAASPGIFTYARMRRGIFTMADLKATIGKVAAGERLSRAEAEEAFDIIMSGAATPVQIGAFLTGLRLRGETVDEIAGAVATMRAKMTPVEAPAGAIDVVGTGGDASGSYNISTASAFVVAGAGVPVAKHGNRALSSKSGAADTLAALGVNIELTPDADRHLHPRGRHRLHVRPGPSFGHAPCRPGPRRARLPHGLQSHRPALQSGQRQALPARRVLARLGRAARQRAARPSAPSPPGWCMAPAASTRCRRPARRRSPGSRTARSPPSPSARPTPA